VDEECHEVRVFEEIRYGVRSQGITDGEVLEKVCRRHRDGDVSGRGVKVEDEVLVWLDPPEPANGLLSGAHGFGGTGAIDVDTYSPDGHKGGAYSSDRLPRAA